MDISGTVLTEEGFAVEGALVTLCYRITETDPMGRFTLADIPAGSNYLIIEHRDFEQYVQPVAIQGEEPDLIVTMTRISTIKSTKS